MMIPLSAGQSLIDEIREANMQRDLTEFELSRFESRARAVMGSDPEAGHSALGILACLRNDEDAMRKHHLQALAFSGNSSQEMHNFSCSLSVCGFNREAADYALKAWNADRSDMLALEQLIHILIKLYELDKAEDLLAVYKQQTGKESELAEYMDTARATQAMFRDMEDDSEEDIVEMSLCAADMTSADWDDPEEDAAWKNL